MIIYKGMNKDMICTRGKAPYQYKLGRTEKNDKAQCAGTGFHGCENPLDVLDWYGDHGGNRYFACRAEGDIHEDGKDKISCTELTPIKELTDIQLAFLGCQFMQKHPDRGWNEIVKKERGEAYGKFVIVRGKHPKAKGKVGAALFLLKEKKKSNEIEYMTAFAVDNENIKEDTWYNWEGKEVSA